MLFDALDVDNQTLFEEITEVWVNAVILLHKIESLAKDLEKILSMFRTFKIEKHQRCLRYHISTIIAYSLLASKKGNKISSGQVFNKLSYFVLRMILIHCYFIGYTELNNIVNYFLPDLPINLRI